MDRSATASASRSSASEPPLRNDNNDDTVLIGRERLSQERAAKRNAKRRNDESSWPRPKHQEEGMLDEKRRIGRVDRKEQRGFNGTHVDDDAGEGEDKEETPGVARNKKENDQKLLAPGAVRVSRMDDGRSSTLMEDSAQDSAADGTNTSKKSFVVEAMLVEDGDEKPVTKEERGRIEAETREKVYGEMGAIAQAEVVANREEAKGTRRWIYCGVVMVVVVLALVLGIVLGRGGGNETDPNEIKEETNPADTSKPTDKQTSHPTPKGSSNPTKAPSTSPTEFIPLNSLICDANVIQVGDIIRGGGLSDFGITSAPTPSGTDFLSVSRVPSGVIEDNMHDVWGEKYGCHGAFNPQNAVACDVRSVHYYFHGNGVPVRANLLGSFERDDCGSSLQVYKIDGDNDPQFCYFRCLEDSVAYPNVNSVAWIAERDVEYLIQVSGVIADVYFDLELLTNDDCRNAHGPIIPGVNTILPGTTKTATVDPEAPTCGTASESTAPGVWYAVTGNGKVITASTCGLAFGFDTQISVFTGTCDDPFLQCVNGNDDSCGKQSMVAWSSVDDQVYYVLVHGSEGTSGYFLLQLSTEGDAVVPGGVCATAPTISLGSSVEVPLASALQDAESDIICSHAEFGGDHFYQPGSIWHKIAAGNGGSMSVTLNCEVSCEAIFLQVFSSGGSDCSDLSCTIEFYAAECDGDSSCQWLSKTEGEIYYVLVSLNALNVIPPDWGSILLTVS